MNEQNSPLSTFGPKRSLWICGAESKFAFHPLRSLKSIACEEFAKDFGEVWAEDEILLFSKYERFCHVENPNGQPQELCVNAQDEVYSLWFEDLGQSGFELFTNATTDKFIECFQMAESLFGDSESRHTVTSLMRLLIDLVAIDPEIREGTFWWGLVDWELRSLVESGAIDLP